MSDEEQEEPSKNVAFEEPPKRLSRTTSVRMGPGYTIRKSNEKQYDQETGTLIEKHQQGIREVEASEQERWRLRRQGGDNNGHAEKRYRVKTTRPLSMSSIRSFFMGPMNYTTFIADYMRWSYRASFSSVSLTILLAFFVVIIFFAVLIYWVGYFQPQCIAGNITGRTYMDPFQLSWTTLSTVGYGVTYPQNANARGKGNLCIGINFVMAFEAFFGVIFAGITGAIIYGKITHIQTVAPVTFSNAVCVRYGTGVAAAQQVEEDEVNGEENKELPFPLLEFRLVNEMSSFSGGEIIDASLAVVATVPVTDDDEGGMIMDEEDQKEKRKPSVLEAGKNVTKGIGEAGKTVTKGIGKATKKSLDASKKVGTAGVNVTKGVGKGVGTAGKNVAQGVGSVVSQMHRHLLRSKRSKKAGSATASGAATPEGSETTDTASVIDEKELEAALEKAFEAKFVEKLEKEREKVAPAITMQQSYIVVDEGSSDLCPARRVHKLMIETDSHPFFKRSWMIRHVLDKSSPLWSPEARRMIERNNGDFPPELNNYEMIRKHLCYKELLVSLSGTSNSSGSTVFAHKVYYFEAVNVGYTFAPMLHSCPSSGKILVDRYLFNDVREQIGGGAEPLVVSDEDEGLVATGVGVAVGATMATAEGVTEGVAAVTAKTLEGVTAAANAVAQGGHQVMGTAMQRNNS